MSHWVKETGFLNEDGEIALAEFKAALINLLNRPEAQAMSEGELRTLGCALHNLVGNVVSDYLKKRRGAKPTNETVSARILRNQDLR